MKGWWAAGRRGYIGKSATSEGVSVIGRSWAADKGGRQLRPSQLKAE